MGQPLRRRLCALLLALVSLAQFGYTLGNPLLWDAATNLLEDPAVHSLRRIPAHFAPAASEAGASRAQSVQRLDYYRPLLRSVETLEYALFGERAWGYHLVNLLVNVAVVLLFFLVVDRVQGDRALALIAALLYAVNPARGEAVVWVYGLSNLLLGLLVFAALLADRAERPRLVWVLCALALLVREDAVLLPLVLLLFSAVTRSEDPKSRVLRALPHFALAAIYLGVRTAVLGELPPVARGLAPLTYLNTVAVVFQRYFRLALYPSHPVAVFPLELFPRATAEVLISYALLVAYLVGLAWVWRRDRRLAFWLGWAGLWLALWFNLGQFGDYLLTEKTMYVASAGLCVVAASLVRRLPRPYREVILGLLLAVHFATTLQRSTYWRDPVTFFRAVVASAPGFTTGHYQLGLAYVAAGEFPAAVESFARTVELDPQHALALNNLGACYYNLGAHDRAFEAWQRSFASDPSNPMVAYNLGFAYEQRGDHARALEHYRRYLAAVPDPPPAIAEQLRGLGLLR